MIRDLENTEKIKNDLISDNISAVEAWNFIQKFGKPWHTKYWKEKRLELLNDECETCGHEGCKKYPLTLQHTKQPLPYKVIHEYVINRYYNFTDIYNEEKSKITESEINEYLSKDFIMKECCPKCLMTSYNYIKKLGKYKCYRCNYEGSDFIKLRYYPKHRKTEKNPEIINSIMIKLALPKANKRACKLYMKYQHEILKESLLIALEESIEYLSFKYIKTLCRKCAYIEDRHLIIQKQCNDLSFNHNELHTIENNQN